MAAYVIAQMTVHDINMYYDYASKIFATISGFGGKVVAANDAEVREGSLPHVRTVIGEFPDIESLRAWYESDAYQAIIDLRKNATDGTLLFVEGMVMPPRDKTA
ncbi:MAG TPA: DUF1330 domain-containing protein [Dehalococcoidia bacterium]|nr:DUF1330 domain-containing protein [Dehalococcoidia bacterium]